MSARFYLHKRSDAGREKSLRLIVYRGGRQIPVTTSVTVLTSDWSQKMQRVKASVPGATDINAELKRLRTQASALALAHPDDEELKAALLERLGRAKAKVEPTLLEHYEAFLAYKKTRVKENTLKVFRTLEAHLKSFLDAKRGGRKMTAGDIGYGFIEDFQTYLLGEGLNNNSTNKYASRLRSFLKWLGDRGGVDTVPKAKPLQTANSHVVRLTLDELAALQNADLSDLSPGHEDARDLFLLCVYTGQRIGDVIKMQWSDIKDDAWYLREEKTGVVRRVPLPSPAMAIVEKRKADRQPVPRLSPQKCNDYIKIVAERAKINAPVTTRSQKGGVIETTTVPKYEAITTHVGRKTFVSLMMEAGVSAKEMLGITHSDLRSLKQYAGASEDHLRNVMTSVFAPPQKVGGQNG